MIWTWLLELTLQTAGAHIGMEQPTPRTVDQKIGPCGGASDVRANVNVFDGGATITVRWDETINHPGHYRISFDEDGTDDFADPVAYDDFYTNGAVLLDEITDAAGGSYQVQVTLPNVTCNNCTLQLMQMMTDKPPYAPGTNDLYYQCADLQLTESATPPGATDDTGPAVTGDTGAEAKTGCGCATGTPGVGGWLAGLVVVSVGLRRRREAR